MSNRNRKSHKSPSTPMRAPQRSGKIIALLVLLGSILLLAITASIHNNRKGIGQPVQAPPETHPIAHLDASETLRALLAAHPSPQIAQDLYGAIEKGEIAWSWTTTPRRLAEFAVVPKSKVAQASKPWLTKEEQPLLFIAPVLLDPRNATLAKLVLFHEYQHVLQWKTGQTPSEVFHTQITGQENDLDALCKQSRQAEMAAYRLECAFAREQGIAKAFTPCTIEDPSVFEATINGMLDTDPLLQRCGS